MSHKSPEQIIQAVRDAGVVGAGGGGFPAHVKLQAKVDVIIANGSECEPLLSSDRTMMEESPTWLIEGMQAAMKATGASRGIIGLKKHYTKAIAALKKELPTDGSITMLLLDNYYPAGDEFLLVYEATGKVIPEGGLPLHVGALVSNAVSLMQIAQALHGKPVTERAVTLVGEFKEPKVIVVPIGTRYADLIEMAGGLTISDVVLIDGGPMMGKMVQDWDLGIGKTTSGVMALPKDHFLVRMAKKTVDQMVRQTKTACCQCFRCSDLCPRSLIGHDLYPHMTMRSTAYNAAEPTKHITSAFLCSQCGVCELIACDIMELSPRKILGAYRSALSSRGVKFQGNPENVHARSTLGYRKMPIGVVKKKLDIARYDVALPFEGVQTVKTVRIPLSKHVGVPAVPVVNAGQKVRRCDTIAASPKDKLGAVYHASIDGEVTAVSDGYIEIRKTK